MRKEVITQEEKVLSYEESFWLGKRKITIDGRTIILRKSRCEITPINAKVYAILQLLTEMDISDGIDVRIKNYLKKFIEQNKISNFDLISLAKFFPAQTTKKLIYGGLLYDIT